MRDYQVTDASVHDAQVFADLPDDSNTSKDVWADSAYRSEEKAAFLKASAVGSHLCLEHSAIYAAKRFLALALRAQTCISA